MLIADLSYNHEARLVIRSGGNHYQARVIPQYLSLLKIDAVLQVICVTLFRVVLKLGHGIENIPLPAIRQGEVNVRLMDLLQSEGHEFEGLRG